MMLFDRYTGKIVSEKELPNEIDFGRYCIADNGKDITYANFPTNKKAIKQYLLLEEYESIHDIFLDISLDIKNSQQNEFEVLPLIRKIKNKLYLNEFEKLLSDKLFHLERIFLEPHYLLNREIEKVHVSKAKRIPSKSYQYLASHTEDWVHKSIVSFKPSRILHEELDLDFNIYENQLTVAFIERCLGYLNKRLKEISDISIFHNLFLKMINENFSKNIYGAKINRNLKLMGLANKTSQNIEDIKSHQSTLSETESTLKEIYKRMLLLKNRELFDLVDKRVTKSISLRDTNIIVNHKHYRYLKVLWNKLKDVRPEKSDAEKMNYEQGVIDGLRQYAKSVITYTLIKTLEYELKGNYKNFTGEHPIHDKIEFIESNNAFTTKIGRFERKIVIIGNEPHIDDSLLGLLKQNNTCLFYYSEKPDIETLQTIGINPLDPDSVERAGIFIKRFLLSSYTENLKRKFKFPQLLRDYVKYIPQIQMRFDTADYTYTFKSYPKSDLKEDDVKKLIEADSLFAKKSRPDKENILKELSNLISEINNSADELRNKFLHCFSCGSAFQSYNVDELNYMKCPSCNVLYDNTSDKKITLKIDDSRYNSLANKEFGMDYISFNTEEL